MFNMYNGADKFDGNAIWRYYPENCVLFSSYLLLYLDVLAAMIAAEALAAVSKHINKGPRSRREMVVIRHCKGR
jgi:hypothetical protein